MHVIACDAGHGSHLGPENGASRLVTGRPNNALHRARSARRWFDIVSGLKDNVSFFITHAATLEDARRRPIGCAIPERVVDLVWIDRSGNELPAPLGARGTQQIGTFPYLARMADPYRHYTFHPTELADLRSEVGRVSADTTLPTEVRAVFRAFADLINEAQAQGHPVFCFGN